jgi:hydrophobe/amphiphile efflux-1 (HAE1) family protein
MQKLAEICIRRPVFASMIVLALVVVGAAGYSRLGVDRYPSVDLPTVSVRTSLPGAAPEEVEALITQQVEEVVNTVDGIDELRSVSGPGTSNVTATFRLDRDLETATQDVRDRVNTILNRLPEDATPPVISKFDNDSSPVLTIALSGELTLRELTELADKTVRVQFERTSGVGEVRVVGGLERAINVWIDADRLAAYQLPITAVRDSLDRQNADLPGGNVTTARQELTLRTMGRYTEPTAFENLVVATRTDDTTAETPAGIPVRIRDIGRVEDGTKEQRSLARLNGVPTVTLEIRRQSGANTIAVIDGVKKLLPNVQSQLPAGVQLEVIRDQSRYIEAAMHEIKVHLVLGSLLACIVVLVFMRSWRSTIIAGVAIPASVIATFGMMAALHFTLNSVTMLALVLMVGIVIDDAIVVLENIFRFIEEKKMAPMEAAAAATKDIGLAVLATTLSLVVIFLPVSFMSSISGRFLYQFGITAAVAIMVSLLVSFTLTPMMSSRLLNAKDAAGGHGSRAGFYGRIDALYTRMLTFSMQNRKLVAIIGALVILTSIPLYKAVKQEFIPTNVDEAEFDVSINGPQGTSLAAMNEAMIEIEKELQATRGVRLVLSSAGGGFLSATSSGGAYVRIAPHEERTLSFTKFWNSLKTGKPWNAFRGNYSAQDVMQEVRKRTRKFAPIRVAPRNPPSFNFGPGGRSDINFVIRGPEIEELAKYADTLVSRTEKLPGFNDLDTNLELDKPELRANIDRARAADLGVSTRDIATSLNVMVGGDQEVTRYRDESVNEDYDVQLRVERQNRDNPAAIERLFVPAENGDLVRLDNVVSIERGVSPSRIDRLDRERQVTISASVAPGYALADRIEAMRGEVAKMGLAPGYTTTITGRGRELERTFKEFVWAFLLSIVFMYMILASQFESTIHPVTILLSLPLAIPFALLSQWLTGNTLNLYSALGILVLFGVVKKNSILQVDHMNNLRAHGMERDEAILQANRDRLRPILMTTLALVAGMLPLALGTGPGSEERRSIAVVVIGGQSLSLLLTLLVTPVAYSLFDDLAQSKRWRPMVIRLQRAKERFALARERRR